MPLLMFNYQNVRTVLYLRKLFYNGSKTSPDSSRVKKSGMPNKGSTDFKSREPDLNRQPDFKLKPGHGFKPGRTIFMRNERTHTKILIESTGS